MEWGGSDAIIKFRERTYVAGSDTIDGYLITDIRQLGNQAIDRVATLSMMPLNERNAIEAAKTEFADLIKDVENGKNLDEARMELKERLKTTSNHNLKDYSTLAPDLLLIEAHDAYLAKQNAAEAAVTASEPISGGKSINVFVDGNAVVFDVQPVIINDRTMIPIRKLANAIGISDNNVMYDDVTRRAVFINGAQTVILTIDNAAAQVNGENVMLDSPATIVSDRTLVPLRFISETFGYTVDYNDDGTTLNVYLTK